MQWSLIDDYEESNYKGYNLDKLTIDQYYLNIFVQNDVPNQDIYLYTLNKECYECPYLVTPYCNGSIKNCNRNETKNIFETNLLFRLSTVYKEYLPQNENEGVICDIDQPFGEFGIYNVNVTNSTCFVESVKEAVNIYTPSLTVILINIALFLIIYSLQYVANTFILQKLQQNQKTESVPVPNKERIQSVDTFRGFAIIIMIFANYGQGGYTAIEHATWNGLHIADTVFPSFLWIMGAVIPVGMLANFKKGLSNKEILTNVMKRSIKLFSLGIFLNSGPDLDHLRIMGVLQRLSIAYLVASVICVYFMDRDVKIENKLKLPFLADIIKLWRGWLIVLGILMLHTILIFTVAPSGCPRGYMGPGGLHKNRSYFNCVGGATGYIDEIILGKHAYQKPTIYKIYESKPFDPEGVVGCLTTIFHIFIGVQAGMTLMVYKKHSERLIRWLIWAVVTGIIGGCLCGFSKEEGIIPVNKNLWSLSFVLVTSCFSFFLLSVFYILVDYKKWWSGKPLLFAGMNSMLMYIGHEMCDNHFPVRWYINSETPRRTHFLSLISDVWSTEFWVLVSYYLYRIKYFFTV